nr:hypothetical protein [uncultured Flavobacterium sp.]
MVSIIKDYLNKITVHSQSLSLTEKYINKPWVHIDNNGNYHKYIFNPDGDLFMSFNGKVEIGKWKYLSEANLIFIDRLTDKIFLKQSFFDQSVMILKIDGANDDLFILANENIIPDLDVAKYLSSLNFEIKNIDSSSFLNKKLINDDILKINREGLKYTKSGMTVFLNDKSVPDGEYFASGDLDNKLIGYQIEDSKIKGLFWLFTHKTSKGVFKIYQKDEYAFSLGDKVFLNNSPAPTGKHKLEFMMHIYVTNGVISGHSIF